MSASKQAPQARSMRQIANERYRDEAWSPLVLRPNALSTTRYDDVARLIRGQRGRLLDVGCGAGQLLLALADQFDQLLGVDVSEVRIDLANAILRDRYPLRRDKVRFELVSPVAPLPADDRSFDAVIACVVLEAVPDVFFTMDEIARVCRPGGCLIVSVANACSISNAVGMLLGRIPVPWSQTRDMARWREIGWEGGALRYFSRGALADLLRHTGFVPEAWSGCGRLAKLRRWHLNLCGGLTVRARRR